MFDPATLRVDANIEEKYLHDVAIGDEADISVDAYPSLRLQGPGDGNPARDQFPVQPHSRRGRLRHLHQGDATRAAARHRRRADLALPGLSVDLKIRVGAGPNVRDEV
jgi:hypothetical protein